MPDKPKAEPKDYSKMDDLTASKAKSNDKLEALLNDAIDNAGLEEKTAALRAELKSLYPGLKFNEAIEMALKLDSSLRADPLGGAAQFAAMNGMPWTPRQLQDKAEVDGLKARIDQVLPSMPGFNDDRVIDILNNPQFVRTGDPMVDLRRAHEVAVRLGWQDRGIENWARQQLSNMPPQLAAAVERTIYTDPQFKAQSARIKASRPFGDPAVHQMNFALAVSIAQEKLASVAKARRAGRVRTSPGGGSSKASSDRGIDNAIASAMSKNDF